MPGRRRRVDLGQHGAFEIEPFGHAFLDEFGAVHCIGNAAGNAQRAGGRARVAEQPGEGAFGIVEHRLQLAFGVRVGVVDRGVDAVQDEAGRPAAADDPAADAGGAFDTVCHGILVPESGPVLERIRFNWICRRGGTTPFDTPLRGYSG